MSIWHFSRRTWLSVYVLHCITAHCFFILTLVLFGFGVLFCLHLCNNSIFFLLLWNDFFCRCSCDNCCHTINGVSQKCAAVCHHCECGWKQKCWAKPGCAWNLQTHLHGITSSQGWKGTTQNNTFQLVFTSHLRSDISQITLSSFFASVARAKKWFK